MAIKKVRLTIEHTIQAEFIAWVRLYEDKIPELKNLFAIANGGYRPIREALKLKAEGVNKGIPDLFLPLSSLGKHGLFLEVKKPGGTLSSDQLIRKKSLENAGYLVLVCYSVEELKNKTLAYINCQDIYNDKHEI